MHSLDDRRGAPHCRFAIIHDYEQYAHHTPTASYTSLLRGLRRLLCRYLGTELLGQGVICGTEERGRPNWSLPSLVAIPHLLNSRICIVAWHRTNMADEITGWMMGGGTNARAW